MPEKAVIAKEPRVLTLKSTEEPPIDKPFYHHIELPGGLRKVLKVREVKRQKSLETRKEQILLWYEKPYTVDKNIIPLVYPLIPIVKDNVMEDCLYPVVIWNVSKERLTLEIHHIPFDKKFPILDTTGAPIYDHGNPIMAFHYIVVNDRYIPNVDPNGKSDDGNFQPGEPVIGRFLKQQLVQMSDEARTPLSYPRK